MKVDVGVVDRLSDEIPAHIIDVAARALYETVDSHWHDLDIPFHELAEDDPFCVEVYREEARVILYAAMDPIRLALADDLAEMKASRGPKMTLLRAVRCVRGRQDPA